MSLMASCYKTHFNSFTIFPKSNPFVRVFHVSCQNSSKPRNPNSYPLNPFRVFHVSCKNSSKPTNPFRVLAPIIRKIRIHQWVESENENYLQNGGIGMALLSVTANAKVRISPFVATLTANSTFVSGFYAWVIAQSIKVILNFFVERKWDFRILCASGGMPSSHSALCTALTTSVALCHGVADSMFPVCLGFTLIVMYDAIGVRRHAGLQAVVLNMIVEDLFQGHPISQRKLKELLGHTPSQVLAGALLGVMVACFCCQGCLVAT